MAIQGKKRVLIVDAEPVVRLGLSQLLRDRKELSLCGEAESLPVAREWCEREKPDIVVLDLAMGDGFGFIKEVPKWSPGASVVVFTSLLDVLTVQRAFKAGALGYVTKRDPLTALMTAIMGALAGERHMGPRVESVVLGTLACGTLEMRGDKEASLSEREREVLRLIGQGCSTRAVALELRLGVKTVETHCKRIKEKLKLRDASALRRHAAIHVGDEQNGSGKNGHGGNEPRRGVELLPEES
jgi:DNA-binding NarL/FixJ family response regulator